jgi:ABC-type lipoprotein release transport system permease subunit
MALPLSYNVRSVLQRPAATLATAVGVGFTVAILIGALALASGFRAALLRTGSPDNALVLRKGADSEISSGLARSSVDILRSDPAVASGADGRPLASPEVVVLINQPRLGQTGSSNVTVRGVDPEALRFRSSVRVVEGRLFTPGTAEIIVGQRVARRFAGCRIGDRLRFGQRQFAIVGLFTTGGSAFESEIWGDNVVLMPVFRGDVFQSFTFRLKEPATFAAVKQRLETDPRLGVDVQRESEFYAAQSELFTRIIQGAGWFIVVIMAIGAVFGAMNTMFAAVGSRTREIATLLILGFSPGAVLASFLIESVFLSLLGGALGCALSLPLNGIVTGTTNFSSFSELTFAFRVTPAALLTGLIFSAVMGLVGGFVPALKAARQPLAAALRDA